MKLRGALLAVPAFFGVAALCGIVAHQNADDRRGRLEVDGRERSYELHVPKNYDGNQPIPLVLALHGRFGTGATGAARPAVWEPRPSFCSVHASSLPVGSKP